MSHLDNDKDLRQEILYEFLNQFKEDKYLSQSNTDKAVEAIDQYTQSKLKAFAEEVKQLIEKSKEDNLDYHGRPDCKNCSLIEDLEALKAIKGKAGIE